MEHILAFFTAKSSALIAGLAGAILSVLMNLRDHTLGTAIISLLAGVAVAYAVTDPLMTFFPWIPENASHAIAGGLGITGRNIVVSLRDASKDPIGTFNRLRNGTPKK